MSKYRKKAKISSVGIFITATILLMLKSNRILFVRAIPESLVYLFVLIGILVYLRSTAHNLRYTSTFKYLSCCWLAIIWGYDQVIVGHFDIIGILLTLITIICASIIVLSNNQLKKNLLRAFTITIQIIVGIGLCGWILFLLGIPLPHYTNDSDPYYLHTIYYLFNLNGRPETQLIPRFAGPFLEPGHCGSMCIFLLYIEKFNLKKWGNRILLLGVIFSLSLAAYGLMVGAILLTFYNRKEYLRITVILGVFISIGILAMMYNAGDNPINTAIVSRLEFDEDGNMVGNNRTSGAFDKAYQKFLLTDEIWFGRGVEAFGTKADGSDNITIGCATYKRYFFLRGIVGAFLIVGFLLYYFYQYRSRYSFGFLIIYIVANCIRDYPTMPMWMFLFLTCIPLMVSSKNYHKKSKRHTISTVTTLHNILTPA